ncbi:Divalent metal cation transporter MntH [Alteripontixanthobacter maritimus]|uniref:Divalent metal cation transporter MntH n=1 Tax=Alteripontixanthobacter maritimus TaxID=2161824 RepID=A0A369Q4R6_9SPHN|nr:NAD(P)H-dependent oxidoreductase [Alteripontixanthobacter maritimus]RDC59724.1 Divalent metal cation transporter MntH [Alteripontixanthobacter maritimus]
MLDDTQERLCAENSTDFSDLKALTINCTLKPSPQGSHTDKLLGIPETILTRSNIALEQVRLADHTIPAGVYPDMTEHGFDHDDWPAIWDKVAAADILIIGTPIWLGEKSSLCQKLVERLYGHSGQTNDKGQYTFYGKVGGCIVTGNEDGIKHVGMGVLYSLQHVGYTIPPQADAGWIGEAGPGPSYGDALEDGPDGEKRGYVGFDNDFTRRNATFMTWNLMHMARMLKDAGGIPAHGNSVDLWKEGCSFDAPNPEYR